MKLERRAAQVCCMIPLSTKLQMQLPSNAVRLLATDITKQFCSKNASQIWILVKILLIPWQAFSVVQIWTESEHCKLQLLNLFN